MAISIPVILKTISFRGKVNIPGPMAQSRKAFTKTEAIKGLYN
jgi:hypothetical protein